MRKTVSIKWLIDYTNKFNATTADQHKEEREGQNRLVEKVMMDAKVYCGFGYLSEREISEDAMSVGIREQKPDGSWNFEDTDHTRVNYYIDRRL